jgi:hypothetical protein
VPSPLRCHQKQRQRRSPLPVGRQRQPRGGRHGATSCGARRRQSHRIVCSRGAGRRTTGPAPGITTPFSHSRAAVAVVIGYDELVVLYLHFFNKIFKTLNFYFGEGVPMQP